MTTPAKPEQLLRSALVKELKKRNLDCQVIQMLIIFLQNLREHENSLPSALQLHFLMNQKLWKNQKQRLVIDNFF
jgi:hypothetical protein